MGCLRSKQVMITRQIAPLVWLLVALPFFISDIRKKQRNSLKWSITHGIKIVSGVAFLAAPIVQLILLFQGHNGVEMLGISCIYFIHLT